MRADHAKTKDYCMTRFFGHGQSIIQVFETSIALIMVKSVKSPFFQTLLVPISWTLAVYVSLTYFGTRPSDRAQIWLACADRYSHLKINLPTPPRGGGFRGLYVVKNLSRRIASKFGTHVRIDTLTLKKIKNLTHPTPGGFRGLYIVKNLSRRIAPKFGTHVRIDTLTLTKLKC